MEKKLKALKAQRAQLILKIDRLLDYTAALPDDEIIEGVQIRLSSTRDAMSSFHEIERDISFINPEEPLEANAVEQKFYEIEAKLGSWIRHKTTDVNLNATMINTTLGGGGGSNACQELRLPKSAVPVFSGEYTEWQTFHDLYCANIHDRTNLTASQKFQFLRSYLKDEAFNLIKHLRISDANYCEAIQKLRDRYNRKKQIVNSFIGTFLEQPSINTTSAGGLLKILDTSDEILRGLKALGNSAEARDPWIIRIMLNKLDDHTKSCWMKESRNEDFPSIQSFFKFLQDRVDELENVKSIQPTKRVQWNTRMPLRGHVVLNSESCRCCGQSGHDIVKCPMFADLSVEERRQKVQAEKLCFNCMKPNHVVFRCGSAIRCSVCGNKHNTFLHSDRPAVSTAELPSHSAVVDDEVQTDVDSQSQNGFNTIISHVESAGIQIQSILPTTVVQLANQYGKPIGSCRVLLDCGSQVSFISEQLVQRLRLNVTAKSMPVAGLGGTSIGKTKGSVLIKILNSQSTPVVSLVAHILPKVTTYLPHQKFNVNHLKYLKNINLADPQFNVPGEIELLVGADQFFNLLVDGQIRNAQNEVVAQNTKLGWVVSGQFPQVTTNSLFVGLNTLESIDESLRKLWEVESLPKKDHLTSEEESCENLYVATTKQDDVGRYVVRLPFKMDPSQIGDNTYQALKRLHSVERRLERDPELKRQYVNFMEEYINLGHMKEISVNSEDDNTYFMPHHGVLQQSNQGIKLRVVFDASATGSMGYSLNDTMRVGPVVQSSLYSILLRFRVHQFVLTADVQRMYRQIRVHEDDAKWQRIMWRNDPRTPVKYYQLETVTYGTRPAPYLATRTLKEIAIKNKTRYPRASKSIEYDTYVDGIMTGCDSEEELVRIRDELVEAFNYSKMSLKKWISNSQRVINSLSLEDIDLRPRDIEETPESLKVLGMQWDPVNDEFKFKVNLDEKIIPTKRGILSEVSRVFDPLGLVAPCIVQIKILLQEIWKKKLDWDDNLLPDLQKKWISMRDDLKGLEQIVIPRWLCTSNVAEIHGFSDASSEAYGAVVYAKVVNRDGSCKVVMVTSKSRVAPLKKLTIPKLELCAALLVSTLLKVVKDDLGVNVDAVFAWTDSTIVLDWLSAYPVKDVFVNNRIAAILDNHCRNCWNYVSSTDNPADIVSRGATAKSLLKSRLWWHGPTWLSGSNDDWPQQPQQKFVTSFEENPYQSLRSFVVTSGVKEILGQLEERISSFYKITRTLAIICKFIEMTRMSKQWWSPSITIIDMARAEVMIFKYIQSEHFPEEINNIKLGRSIISNSRLIQLNPFLDSHGVLRVGGRLSRATLDFNVKHPVILLAKAELVRKMMQEWHGKYHHAGATLVLSLLKQRFWIIGARTILRQLIRGCVQCIKSNPRFETQMMADLPLARVEYTRPFLKIGIDYAGPFQVTPLRRRGQRSIKSYVCIFICLATRAVHIELVADLSTDTFLAALKRMISRRGICTDVYTDCGTNFVGASRKLIELYKFLKSNTNHISEYLLRNQISWHFNPPGAPHFGGSWEAAVKVMKTHLHRVLGNIVPTIDEFQTLLVEIEGIMNSRPLCRTSGDDIDCLTPAHLLIGHPISSIPDTNGEERSATHLQRWEMVQQLKRNFWSRWCYEYLLTLQRRSKWCNKKPNVEINDVVIVKDESLVAKQYVLGKVIEVYPGNDGLTRAVKLKTSAGELKRPIHKLCILPISEPSDSRGAECLRK